MKVKRIIAGIFGIIFMLSSFAPAASAQDTAQVGKVPVTTGTLETFTLNMPQFTDGRTRTIRVWLPDGYNANDKTKTYPVIYMQDGQNIFTNPGSSWGWQINDTVSDYIKKGYQGSIIVGIDNNGMQRIPEYTPSLTDYTDGNRYADFVVNTVKPYIDSHYNTNPDRQHTGIGGSSCGAGISFYIAMEHPDIYGFAIIMSFFGGYSDGDLIASKSYSNTDELPEFFLYSGGKSSFEQSAEFRTKGINSSLLENGYPQSKIKLVIDETQDHNEAAWCKYFKPAYEWFAGVFPIVSVSSSSNPAKVSSSMSSAISSSAPASSVPDTESKVSNPNTGNVNRKCLIYTLCISIFLLIALFAFIRLKAKTKK